MKRKTNPASALRRQLLRWYDRNRRDLPWRRTRDPYRIWVSEIMLQQTRVQAVIPYYEKFLRRFPDIRSLAEAKEEELLACWSGLGYYSRARNLQKAAQAIVREHEGQFPRDLPAALALPGIGRYTAAAVLSIAYGIPLPVLDGNVARVLARFYALRVDARSASGRERLWQEADDLLSRRRPGDFNQALMELGAMVCLPQQPRCPSCPLRGGCLAYARDEVAKFPESRRKAPPVLRRYVAALVQDRTGRFLLVRRPRQAKWLSGFWELPMWEQGSSVPPFSENGKRTLAAVVLEKKLGTVRHTITDNRLQVEVFAAALGPRSKQPKGKWIAREHLGRYAVTTITRKALALLST
jgi:A/G-specific adenine glycosylase